MAEGSGGSGSAADTLPAPDVPYGMDEFLTSWTGTGMFDGHIVVRATYLPNTIRCEPVFYDRSHNFGTGFDNTDRADPPGLRFINCYTDVRVNDYVLGSGPPTLTVQLERVRYGGVDASRAEELRASIERALVRGEHYYGLWTQPLEGGFAGREEVLFLGPALNSLVEAWMVTRIWDVQRQDDGTVVAVHPSVDIYKRMGTYETHKALLEMTLPAFGQAVTTTHQARIAEPGGRVGDGSADHPMTTTDADRLEDFYRSTGAYDNPEWLPEQPPPPCGLAVADQLDNPGLMRDCFALLAAKDPLRGTGALNWDTGVAITAWDGVTVAGTPQRVTKLKLTNKNLTGTIPEALADLDRLVELKLAGNTLTGCIPLKLKDVPGNDLSSLNLLYCQPPAPGNVSSGAATETGIPISWDAVSNAGKYRGGDSGD